MAITLWALNQLGGVRIVPGILSLKSDDRALGQVPLPLRWGPICERCWMADGIIVPADACPHRRPR